MRLTVFVLSSIFFALNASSTEGHQHKRRSKKTIANRISEQDHSLNQLDLVRSGSGKNKEKKSFYTHHNFIQNNELGKGHMNFKKILVKHSEIPKKLNDKSVKDNFAINNIDKHGNIPEFNVSNDSISKKDVNENIVANNSNQDREHEIKTKSLLQLQQNKTSKPYQTSSGSGLFNLKETNQDQVHKELRETSDKMQIKHEGTLHERVFNNTENYHHKYETLMNENTLKPANNPLNSQKYFKAGTLIISDDSTLVAQQPKVQILKPSFPILEITLKNQTKFGSAPVTNRSSHSAGQKSKNSTQRTGAYKTQLSNDTQFSVKKPLILNAPPVYQFRPNKVTINVKSKTLKTDENINGATGDELLQNIGFKKAIFLKDKVTPVKNKTDKAFKKKKPERTQHFERVKKIRKSFGKSDEKKTEHLTLGHLAERDLDDEEAADRKYFSGKSVAGSSLFSKIGLKPQFNSEREGFEEERDETERVLFSPKKPEDSDEDSDDYDKENVHGSNKKEYSDLSHNTEQYNNLREHSSHEKDDDDQTENQEHKTHGFSPMITEKLLLHKKKFHSPNAHRENLFDEDSEENIESNYDLKNPNYLDNKQLHDDNKDENEEYNNGFQDHNSRLHYRNNRKFNQHNSFHDHSGANDHNNEFHHSSKERSQARREDSADFDQNDDLDVWKNIVRMNSDVEPSDGLETSDNTLVDSEESDAAALLPTDPKILAGFGVNDQRFGETWFEGQKNIERETKKVKHHGFSSERRFKDEDSKDIHELESFVEPDNDDDIKANKKPKKKSHKKHLQNPLPHYHRYPH